MATGTTSTLTQAQVDALLANTGELNLINSEYPNGAVVETVPFLGPIGPQTGGLVPDVLEPTTGAQPQIDYILDAGGIVDTMVQPGVHTVVWNPQAGSGSFDLNDLTVQGPNDMQIFANGADVDASGDTGTDFIVDIRGVVNNIELGSGNGSVGLSLGGVYGGVTLGAGNGQIGVAQAELSSLVSGAGNGQTLIATGDLATFQIEKANNHLNLIAAGKDAINPNLLDTVNLADTFANAHISQQGATQTIKFADTGQVVNITGQATVHFSDGVTETANPGQTVDATAQIAAILAAHHFIG
jgi:hypothetical protein